MRDAFATVLWVVCGVSVAGALLTLVLSGRAWSEVGRGGLTLEREPDGEPGLGVGEGASDRLSEIRALVQARNDRRLRRGEEPIDVEAEVARLAGADSYPSAAGRPRAAEVDPQLRLEIRSLVEARNARRLRRGEEPVDVETEVERQIADLGGGASARSRAATASRPDPPVSR